MGEKGRCKGRRRERDVVEILREWDSGDGGKTQRENKEMKISLLNE